MPPNKATKQAVKARKADIIIAMQLMFFKNAEGVTLLFL